MDNGRLALISKRWTTNGMNIKTQEFLLTANRKKTHLVYDHGWKKFTTWCALQDPVRDPEEYIPKNVLDFLMEYKDLSAQTLNGYRSAIASVFNNIHPDQPPIASQPDISRFFQAKRDVIVKVTTVENMETWDVNLNIIYVSNKL